MTIGQVIKKIIKKRGLTQVEVAKSIGKSTTALSQIINGVYEPNPESLEKLCSVLEVPKPILYFMMISEEDLPEEKKEIFKDFEPVLKDFISEVFN
jgi:transcriptional regulator with XRE-family HTH domain